MMSVIWLQSMGIYFIRKLSKKQTRKMDISFGLKFVGNCVVNGAHSTSEVNTRANHCIDLIMTWLINAFLV